MDYLKALKEVNELIAKIELESKIEAEAITKAEFKEKIESAENENNSNILNEFYKNFETSNEKK